MRSYGVIVRALVLGLCIGTAGAQESVAPGPDFIEKVRKSALGYVAGLPNFVCKQKVRRYVIFDLDHREILDEVVTEMAFYEGAEHAKVLTVGNHPATDEDLESLAGLSSHGEFGVSLAALFSPETKAFFEDDGTEKIRDRKTIRLKYSVPLETSSNQISLGSVATVTAYRGRCWIDPETFQVVRLEDIAVDIPADIPISASSSRTDYDLVEIAGRQYWLPVSANVRMVAESKPGREIYNFYENILGKIALPNYNPRKVEAINSITFEDYQKFGAEVKVTF